MDLVSSTVEKRFFKWFVIHRDRLRRWAYDNACMLTFMLGLNVVTWSLIVATQLV